MRPIAMACSLTLSLLVACHPSEPEFLDETPDPTVSPSDAGIDAGWGGPVPGPEVAAQWKEALDGPDELEAAVSAEAKRAAQAVSACVTFTGDAKSNRLHGTLVFELAGPPRYEESPLDRLVVHFADGSVGEYVFSRSEAERWDVSEEVLLAHPHDLAFQVTRSGGTDVSVEDSHWVGPLTKSIVGWMETPSGVEKWDFREAGKESSTTAVGGIYHFHSERTVKGSLERTEWSLTFDEERITDISKPSADVALTFDEKRDFNHHFTKGSASYEMSDGQRISRQEVGRPFSILAWKGTLTLGGLPTGGFRSVHEPVGAWDQVSFYLVAGNDSVLVERQLLGGE